MIVDTEFEPGECPDIDEDADQDSINSRGIYDLSRVTTRLSLHDFLKSAENLFLLSQLCSSGHGAWGQSVHG